MTTQTLNPKPLHYTNGLYTTHSEKKFIDGIGTYKFTTSQAVIRHTREEHLAKYIKSCSLREHWGDIRKEEVILYAKAQLLLERIPRRT